MDMLSDQLLNIATNKLQHNELEHAFDRVATEILGLEIKWQ